ncbi:hypothetical protein FH972_024960 [Carpinus fangiana]|uniref:Uncharacterized protein n=1 Tax=Carpinus fangiana TaxID=176857 RepID=A0A5N6KZM4_9ROSI|nr:hypothetical protein FH972_024960 [Carpinus fangiana]
MVTIWQCIESAEEHCAISIPPNPGLASRTHQPTQPLTMDEVQTTQNTTHPPQRKNSDLKHPTQPSTTPLLQPLLTLLAALSATLHYLANLQWTHHPQPRATCLFCTLPSRDTPREKLLYASHGVYAIHNRVSAGRRAHYLIFPAAHVRDIEGLASAADLQLLDAMHAAKQSLLATYHPEIGAGASAAAGDGRAGAARPGSVREQRVSVHSGYHRGRRRMATWCPAWVRRALGTLGGWVGVRGELWWPDIAVSAKPFCVVVAAAGADPYESTQIEAFCSVAEAALVPMQRIHTVDVAAPVSRRRQAIGASSSAAPPTVDQVPIVEP